MWHWVCAINICTIQPNRKGLPPPPPGLAQRASRHQGGRVTHGAWQEQTMRQGSRHGVPRTGGAGPPKGRTWPLPLETPKLGRGARRARRGSPINTKRGGCASPKDRICTGWHPRFPQETAAGSYKTFTASSPQRKKIRGWVRSDRGGTSCLKGLRLPCKAQGSPLHIQSWGHVGPLEPTKARGLGAQGTKGNK